MKHAFTDTQAKAPLVEQPDGDYVLVVSMAPDLVDL
jgi:hypothetical protein